MSRIVRGQAGVTRKAQSRERLVRAAVEVLESRRLLSAGGGFTDAGIIGEYFANTTSVGGTPTFTRKDVRVDFDWGTAAKPGGSTAPGFNAVAADNYAIRWTGQVIPRFSETYTFKTISDEGVRLYVKPAGGSTWTTVIDDWTGHAVTTDTGTYAMTAGQAYDIKLEYYEGTGSAKIQLKWSSPSTPEEVIDPLIESGINNPDWSAAFVDITKGATQDKWQATQQYTTTGDPVWDSNWEAVMLPAPGVDSNGWPTGDGGYIFSENNSVGLGMDPLMTGTIHFSFTGEAIVTVGGNVNSLTYSYNSSTNTTTGSFVATDGGSGSSSIAFHNAWRDTAHTVHGITDLKMMRPVSPGSSTSYASDGRIFTPQIEDAMSHFTVIRHQYVADRQTNWSDRTLPTFFNQNWGKPKVGYQSNTGENQGTGTSWEYKVMLSNETGRDLMISLPIQATDDYLTKLANLLKYGSDGTNPYTSPQTNPAYPPLNPNLRVYLELGNELWNYNGVFGVDQQNLDAMTQVHVTNNDADFQAMNFDNDPNDPNGMNVWRYREAFLRMKTASTTFRSVFGDDAMMTHVRPLYEWQYDNQQNTARNVLVWADNYFNNADGTSHVTTPHPVSYYLWGGGGATYYGSSNPNGLTDLLPNSDFETPALATGSHQAPTGASWTFSGTAGIARDGGTSDDIPTPYNGAQVGYITGQGSMTATVTFPSSQTSNVYAVSFKAYNKSGNTQNLRVFLDYGTSNQTDITAITLNNANGYTPPSQPVDGQGNALDTKWQARNVWWTNSDYYYTNTFTASTSSQHTITIVGTSTTGQTAFMEDVRVTSVDALFANNAMPGGGQATGQDPGSGIRNTMNVEASWAKAFGLQELSYESGWSLGGDDGGSPLQMQAKYADSRTADVQKTFMDWFYQSGSAVNVFGTYAQWPNWMDPYVDASNDHVQGLEDVSQFPILQGIDDRQNHLPAEATNGVAVPAVLKAYNASITQGTSAGQGRLTKGGDFLNWNVIVPKAGSYAIGITTGTGSGGYTLLIDGSPVTGSTFTLTKGQHSIKVRSTSSTAVTVDQVSVVAVGAPSSPALSSAVDDGNASATLTWGSVTGATGYTIRYGTTPGVYASAVDAGNSTTGTVSGLTAGQHYYFAVGAYNASGESLPSNEKGVLVVQSGITGQLLWWEFSGGDPAATSAPVSGATSRVTVSGVSRGSGLAPTTAVTESANTFGSEPSNAVANHAYGQSLSAAITNGQYYEFTVTPASSSYPLTLTGLDFQPYFQDPNRSTLGAGITFSTDGGTTYSSGIAATGTPQKTGSPFHVDLSGYTALQGATGSIKIRIYLFGGGNWEYSGIGGTGDDISISGYYGTASTGGTPTTPSNLTATAASDTAVNLSWTDNSSNETMFGIDVATDPSFSSASYVGYYSTAANATTKQITGLTAGTTYYFRVFAGNNGNYSANSNTASATTTNSSATPATPSGLAATGVSPTEVDLTWTDNSSNETMFGIDVATDPSFSSASYVGFYSTAANVTSKHITGLTAGVTYYFRVFAGNNGNYSANSSTASATTYPNAPSSLTATTVSGTTINLSWTDNSSNETMFGIDVATDPSFSSASYVGFYSTGSNTTFYQITGLSPGTTYYFRVFAGENGVFSYNSNTASATT